MRPTYLLAFPMRVRAGGKWYIWQVISFPLRALYWGPNLKYSAIWFWGTEGSGSSDTVGACISAIYTILLEYAFFTLLKE